MIEFFLSGFLVSAVCSFAVCNVVRERKKSKAISTFMEQAIEAIPQGFLYFGSNEILTKDNKAARLLLPQIVLEESPLRTVDGFLDFVFANKHKGTGSSGALAETKPSQILPHDFREIINCHDRICLLQASHVRSSELMVFLTDITEVKMQEAQFVQAQKLEALGQLAGGVAHDFNNVLSIVDGYARMAEKAVRKTGGNEQLEGHLERIKLASKRGAALTKQLLLFGRHKIVGDDVIDLARAIYAQEKLLQPLLDSSMHMNIDIDKDLPVECPPDGLAQIIMNLVINARDAMPEGGKITITGKKSIPQNLVATEGVEDTGRQYACLSVSDTGIGMDQKVIERIFEPFFTTKEQGKGTGLGLSMVYGVVKELKGFIDLETEPGEGTSFHIYLPLSNKKTAKAIHDTDENAAGLRFDGYTALIAEDEPDLLDVVASMLEDLGMEVLKARNGAEALVMQDEYEGDIDLLLTDVVMPELNGVKLAELFEAVREETRVIFMSGFPANGKMARVSLPNQAILLAKPVNYEKLAIIMKNILDEDYSSEGRDDVALQRWQVAN